MQAVLAAKLGLEKTQGLLVPLASWQQSSSGPRERLVTVQEALRRPDFQTKLYCPQCDQALSLRREGVAGRRAHFYHLTATTATDSGEGLLHLLAKAFIEAKLAEITFRWSDCARSLACQRQRCFTGCTAVLEQTLGAIAPQAPLPLAETRLRPDVTILDQHQTVVAFVEIFVSSRKEGQHWQAYAKFPQAVALEIDFNQPLHKSAAGLVLQDTKQAGPPCAACTIQETAKLRDQLAQAAEAKRQSQAAKLRAEQQRTAALAKRAAAARALVRAKLADITFRWAMCAWGLAPQCWRQRRFDDGCTAVYRALTADYQPDLTILDQNQQVVALIEFCPEGRPAEPPRWEQYSRFPGILWLEVDVRKLCYVSSNGYTLTDIKARAQKDKCAVCAAASRAAREQQQALAAQEEEDLQRQLAEEEFERQCTFSAGSDCASEPMQVAYNVRLERALPPRVQKEVLAGGLPAWLSDEEAATMPVLTYTPGAPNAVWVLEKV